LGLGREAGNGEIAADHDHGEIDAGEEVGEIVVDLIDFLIAVAQLVVDSPTCLRKPPRLRALAKTPLLLK